MFPLLEAKFGWSSKEETERKIALLTGAFIATQMFGLAFGTYLLKFGRRHSLLIGCYLGCFGGVLHMILIWPIHVVGVAVSGVGYGIMTITHARYI